MFYLETMAQLHSEYADFSFLPFPFDILTVPPDHIYWTLIPWAAPRRLPKSFNGPIRELHRTGHAAIWWLIDPIPTKLEKH